jgi:hypothetical protein
MPHRESTSIINHRESLKETVLKVLMVVLEVISAGIVYVLTAAGVSCSVNNTEM